MEQYFIEVKAEYDYCMARGIQPLAYTRFAVEIFLRVEIQRELFGMASIDRDVIRANQKFYQFAWENSKHYCEECLAPLRDYSASYVSHILTRGAHPDMAHDFRNINILCPKHHSQWETGERKTMRIYEKNQKTIELLKSDYQKLNEN